MTRQQLLNEVEHDIMRKPNSINIIYHSPVWRSVSEKTVPEVLDTTSGPLAEGGTNNRGNNILFFLTFLRKLWQKGNSNCLEV